MVSHVEKLRVRWVDTDASGIIHYTAAFRYFEAAEWELFRKVGVPFRPHEKDFGLPRVAVSAEFHAQLRVDDEIAVHIRVDRLGTTSLTFALEIFREETLCVNGSVTVVFINAQSKPIPIPDYMRRALTAA